MYITGGRRGAVNLGSVLKFVTGSEEEPVLGFQIAPSIHFHEGVSFLPTANTCTNRMNLTLPSGSIEMPPKDELFFLFDYAFSNTFFGLE